MNDPFCAISTLTISFRFDNIAPKGNDFISLSLFLAEGYDIVAFAEHLLYMQFAYINVTRLHNYYSEMWLRKSYRAASLINNSH